MSKLIIKNLGPITDFEMDIKDFNLIIGEQAVGKSTICKCIYFFKLIKNEIIDYLFSLALNYDENSSISNERLKFTFTIESLFIKLFGKLDNFDSSLSIQYKYYIDKYIDIRLSCIDDLRDLVFNYSDDLEKIMIELEDYYFLYSKKNKKIDGTFSFNAIEKVLLHQDIKDKIYGYLNDNTDTYYIPAARSSLSFINNQKTKLNYEAIDLVNLKFIQFIENIQNLFSAGINKINYPNKRNNTYISNMSEKIINLMKGEYFYENGTEYILLNSEKKEKIPVNYISSGHQEILWLLNILYYLIIRNEKAFVIIEEPEAHLYPKMQKEIVDFIVNFMNITESTVFITTHSPYILTSTNNLLYAGKIRKEKNNDEVNKKIDKLFGKYGIIDTDKINAFKLYLKDYKTAYSNLINENSGEIMTELIDEISDYINETYTKLIDIEEDL